MAKKSAMIKPFLLISFVNFQVLSATERSQKSVPLNSGLSIQLQSYLDTIDDSLQECLTESSSDDSVDSIGPLDYSSCIRPVNPECLLIMAQNYLASAESYREDAHTSSYIALQSLKKFLEVLESTIEDLYPDLLIRQINKAHKLTQQNPSSEISRNGNEIYRKIQKELESLFPKTKIKRHPFVMERTSHSKKQEKNKRNHRVASLPEDSSCCFGHFW